MNWASDAAGRAIDSEKADGTGKLSYGIGHSFRREMNAPYFLKRV